MLHSRGEAPIGKSRCKVQNRGEDQKSECHSGPDLLLQRSKEDHSHTGSKIQVPLSLDVPTSKAEAQPCPGSAAWPSQPLAGNLPFGLFELSSTAIWCNHVSGQEQRRSLKVTGAVLLCRDTSPQGLKNENNSQACRCCSRKRPQVAQVCFFKRSHLSRHFCREREPRADSLGMTEKQRKGRCRSCDQP